MRKSNLVKAMACFMAATMAVTCVPSAGITNNLTVVASAAEEDTKESTEEKTIDAAGWWTDFSDYYRLTGDFDITFQMYTEKGPNIWSNPATVFTTPVERGNSAYKEFALVRADGWGWGGGDNLTHDGNAITYANSCDNNWDTFCNAMNKVNMTRNIIRSGNDFTIIDTFIANGTTYISTKTFTTLAGDTINIFLVGDQSYTKINFFSGNILSSQRGDIAYEDGVYLINESNDAIIKNGTGDNATYSIDLGKIFTTTKEVTAARNGFGEITCTIPCSKDAFDVTKEVTFNVYADNPCTVIKSNPAQQEVKNETIRLSLNESLDLASILEGRLNGRITTLPNGKVNSFTPKDTTAAIQEDDFRAFFTIDNSSIDLKSITNNKTEKKTEINKTIMRTTDEIEKGVGGFFTHFSDSYALKGQFDVTFNFINHGGDSAFNNFVLVLTSDSDRGTPGYKEYAVIRADKAGWVGDLRMARLKNYRTEAGRDNNWFDEAIFTAWDEERWGKAGKGDDLSQFITDMKNAAVSLRLQRNGDTIIMTADITPAGSNKTYKYQTKLDYLYTAPDINAVAAISQARRDSQNKNNHAINTITSRVEGEGTISLYFEDEKATAVPRTINYEFVNNTCSAIDAFIGNGGNLVVNQAGSVAVYADGNDKTVKLNSSISVDGLNLMNVGDSGTTVDNVKITLEKSDKENGRTVNVYSLISSVASGSSITFRCGGEEKTIDVTFKAASDTTNTTTPSTTTPGTTTPGTTTPGTPETPTGPAITTGGAVDPGDVNKPEDENKPGDNQPGNTEDPGNNNENPTTPEEPGNTTTTKKKAKVSAVKAAKGAKKVTGTVKLSSGKVVKKATVKVYVNNKKKKTVTTNNKGKFTAKLSKKLKKGDKVKVVITKSTIKKITKTVKVK